MKPETMIERLRHLLARNVHPKIMAGRKLLEGALDVVLVQREEAARLMEALEAAGRECAAVKAERDAAREAICDSCEYVPCRGESCMWWRGAQGEG